MLYACLLACDNSTESIKFTLSDWVNSHTDDKDKLRCQKTVGDNSFFVALNESIAKTGYLLDVGDVLDKPYIYIFSWDFRDEEGNYLITNKLSTNVSKQYVTMNDTVYSESIDMTTLNLEKVDKVIVTVITKTYIDKADVPEQLKDVVINDESAKFKLCEINVR